ncbi:GNAT family N-acetyltransferase [Nocardiopsis sp. NPDC007018]|uniref:GNAT family N-acetyltransferase n=1 Tax=Nocardiopsis sp. NPDC007018 TaxID=3155721 RepID=UPI0033EF065A
MTDRVRVRERTDDDLTALSDLLVRVHAHDGYPVEGVADPRTWLTDPGFLRSWVAEHDGALLGQVSLAEPEGADAVALWSERTGRARDEAAVLSRLFVSPSARGRGVGESLTRAVMEHARRHDSALVLDVMAKDRSAARLYERLGWERLGAITHAFDGSPGVPAYCYAWDSSTR